MDVRNFVEKVLASAKIPRSRCKVLQWHADYAVVEINGDYCSSKLVVLVRPDGLVLVQVRGAGVLVKVYAPMESLLDEFIFSDIVEAVESAKDWQPVVVDWAALAEELEDCVAVELGVAG